MLTCLHHDTAVSGQSLHRTSDRIIAYISSDNIVLYLLETKLFFSLGYSLAFQTSRDYADYAQYAFYHVSIS